MIYVWGPSSLILTSLGRNTSNRNPLRALLSESDFPAEQHFKHGFQYDYMVIN